jgi:hypothetical protein
MTAYAGQITISKANPIRFVHNDSLAASFDNTLTADESFAGIYRKPFYQKFINDEHIPLQLKLYGNTSGNEVILKKNNNGTETVIAATASTVYSSFTIYEYLIQIKTGESFYLVAYTDIDTWTSETLCGEASLPGYTKLEWFNYDPLTYNENYQFDYQTSQAKAVVNFLYLQSNIFEYAAAGEKTVIDNQNEKIVLKRSVFRRLKLESDPIPRWLAEKLTIAMSHDVFVVNDVSYVLEEEASIDKAGKTNFVNFSAVLTQKAVLGINTYDLGINGVMEMIHLDGNAIAAATTFTVPAGYLIAWMTCYRTAGDPVIIAGTTVGGTNIVNNMTLNGTTKVWSTSNISREIAPVAAATLYVGVSGGTCNIDILLIKNRP